MSEIFQVSIAGGLVAAIGLLYREMIASKNAQLASQKELYEGHMLHQKTGYEGRLSDMKSQKESFKEIANEAVENLEKKVNEILASVGKSDFKVLAAVVPEHNSPTTPEQQDTADLATLRARTTAAVLALGLPPREASEPAAVVVDELGPKAIEQIKEIVKHESSTSED